VDKRFYSLDIFRGATVALMILVNNPGSWSHIYSPLKHAPWHGCTPTDLVFPFFLFAVGNAMAFVMPRLEAAGTKAFLRKVITRSLLIFGIGLFLHWSPFVSWQNGELAFRHWVDPENANNGVRILGVLQRIALCYFFASLIIYFLKIRGALVVSIIFLLIYWALCLLLGTAGDPYSLEGYFGTQVDKDILGVAHMYKGEGVAFDPEGITSTLPAIVQVIFGYFVGFYIQQKGKNFEMLTHLFIAGSILIFTGFAWDLSFPINKKIWTSSYVLYTTGLAIMVLGVLIHLVEMKKHHEVPGWKPEKNIWFRGIFVTIGMALVFISPRNDYSWLLAYFVFAFFLVRVLENKMYKFFDVFGKNALFIFFLSGFLPRILGLLRWVDHVDEKGNNVYTTAFSWFYQHACKPVSADLKNGSLLYALSTIIFYWLIVYWMDKKKIYIKV
jgi:predicted acyltransferase